MNRALVTHANSTVLGYCMSEHEWNDLGLDFTHAVLHRQSTLMVALVGLDYAPEDIHLNVPVLPDGDEDWSWYRVRPRSKRVTGAERDDAGDWWWVEEPR